MDRKTENQLRQEIAEVWALLDAERAGQAALIRRIEQERDELQKRAERMQKALSDIAEWTDRYTTPGHPVSTIARAAIAQDKGE